MKNGFSIELHQPRHEPVGTSQRTLDGRPTYIATWESPWKTVVGEATPLAGFGSDDLTAAYSALSAIPIASLLESSARVVQLYEEGQVLAMEEDDTWSELVAVTSASARFCLETLVLQAAAAACNVPLWRLLAQSSVAPSLPQSAVLDPMSDTGWEHFEREVARGVRTFKVKCGRESTAESRYLREVFDRREDVSIRLDPNRAWTLREAEAFLLPWIRERIEWVEDPTPAPSEWGRLRESTGLLVALDEPLSEGFDPLSWANVAFDVLVLKPMALGGFSRCLQLARQGRQDNKRIVISHLFDGPASLDACIQLAFAIQSPDVAPGLGEHAALAGYAGAGLGKSALLEGARMTAQSRT